MIGGLLGGFVLALVTIFKKEWSPITAPVYALLEWAVGSLAAFPRFSIRHIRALPSRRLALTFGTLFVMLLAYKTHMIQATRSFKIGVIAATGGIAVFYFAEILLGFFHVHGSGGQ